MWEFHWLALPRAASSLMSMTSNLEILSQGKVPFIEYGAESILPKVRRKNA